MKGLIELKYQLLFIVICTLRVLVLLVIYPLWFWLLWKILTWVV